MTQASGRPGHGVSVAIVASAWALPFSRTLSFSQETQSYHGDAGEVAPSSTARRNAVLPDLG